MRKYLCLGIGIDPFFIVAVTNELIYYRIGRVEDLNPSGQTGEQPGVVPNAETMLVDSTQESLGAWWFMEESTTAAGGVEGGERLATTTSESAEMPGAMVRAAESSEAEAEAEAGATDIVPEIGAQRPEASEEQATCPEMPRGMFGHFMRPSSPQRAPSSP